MKMSKKLLASQVNSVRPYKSRSKRPCDFCRRRKTCCIIENSIPCMACAQFNKGECTFLEQPLKRSKRDSEPCKERVSKPRKNSKSTQAAPVSQSPLVDSSKGKMSPGLAFPLDLKADLMRGDPLQNTSSRLGFPQPEMSSWQQVMDQSRSYSTGNIHTSQTGASSMYSRGSYFSQPLDSIPSQVVENQPLHQELVEEYKQYSLQQQQQQQQQQHQQNHQLHPHQHLQSLPSPHIPQSRSGSLPQPRELDHLENSVLGQQTTNQSVPYRYYYSIGPEPQPSLDNSEFVSSATGSISSSRLSTSVWSPQTLETVNSAFDINPVVDPNDSVAVSVEPGTDLEYSIGSKFLTSQASQPPQLGLHPLYYCQDTYNNFNNGGFFNASSTTLPTQTGPFQSTMK
ncbi:hypothetical protein JCM33374_g6230 [Metschnikowia sp. JCM 33374]|nr:hypothetical protein JCM33374_g6230 [Metschnikowia sp. JCM 33374]